MYWLFRPKPLQFASLPFAMPHPVVIAVMLPEKSVASAMEKMGQRYPMPKSVAAFSKTTAADGLHPAAAALLN